MEKSGTDVLLRWSRNLYEKVGFTESVCVTAGKRQVCNRSVDVHPPGEYFAEKEAKEKKMAAVIVFVYQGKKSVFGRQEKQNFTNLK